MLQLILSIIAFLCVLTEVVAHIAKGNISTLAGYAVSAAFLLGTYAFIHYAWKDMYQQ